MEVSEQIIAVFDNLAQKFGVVIDWGRENVIPYIQQLCTKYITWEIATSIIWMCFGIILVIAGFAFFKAARKWHDVHKNYYDYVGVITALLATAAIFCWIIALIVVTVQMLDIVRCCIFPELQIFEFVRGMTT